MGLFSIDGKGASLRGNSGVQARNARIRAQEAASSRRHAQRKANAVREAKRIGKQSKTRSN